MKGILIPHVPYILPEIGGSFFQPFTRDLLNHCKMIQEKIIKNPPDVILISSPHYEGEAFSVGMQEKYQGNLGAFQRPDIVDYRKGNKIIAEILLNKGVDMGYLAPTFLGNISSEILDYGSIVALRLIDPKGIIPIVPISVSSGNHSEHLKWGEKLSEILIENQKIGLFVASTELSQDFSETPEAEPNKLLKQADQQVIKFLINHDFDNLLKIPSEYLKYTEKELRSIFLLAGFTKDLLGNLLNYSGLIGCGCGLITFD
ncbi:MAG: hypothetical protein ACFFD1_07645 [Candidatus Thorarchaeota archaeon]